MNTWYLPYTEDGTDKAAAACILTLKLEESRNSSKRILKSDDTLAKQQKEKLIINTIVLQQLSKIICW